MDEINSYSDGANAYQSHMPSEPAYTEKEGRISRLKGKVSAIVETIKSVWKRLMDCFFKPDKGGLNNLGSTCYMNSGLQMLLHIPSFSSMIDQKFAELNGAESKDAAYLKALKNVKDTYFGLKKEMALRAALKNLHEVVVVDEATRLEGFNEPLRGQQDASEFLSGMLQAIGYRFTLKETRGIEGSRKEVENRGPADTIWLPLVKDVHGKVSFSHLIRNFAFQNIGESGDAKLEKCAVTQTIVDEIPNTLVVQLPRSEFNFKTGRPEKINDLIEVDEEIDLKDLIDPSLQEKSVSTSYRLAGVIHHVGGGESGHYFADISTPQGWTRMNDKSVRKLSEKNAAEERKKGYMYVLERVFPQQPERNLIR